MTPSVVLFDGVCNLCNGAVRFIAKNDPAGRFSFASLQSPQAAALLGSEHVVADTREPESLVLLDYGKRYDRSDAALHIALGLRAPWPLAFVFILVPRALRDAVYRWVARNRYRWFGRMNACPLPDQALANRFLV